MSKLNYTLSEAQEILEKKYPRAFTYLSAFYDRFDSSIERIVAELPCRNPELACTFAQSLKAVLEKKDVPWRVILSVTNIHVNYLPDEESTWKWVVHVIDVLEGNVAQEHRDFWKENRDKSCFWWAEKSLKAPWWDKQKLKPPL